jgi:hypothetical protein
MQGTDSSAGQGSPAKPHWRDRIKVHPAAELFPMMTDAELDELGKDIAENGLRHDCVFYGGEKRPENSAEKSRKRVEAKIAGELPLLDGRNRFSATERRGGRIERVIEGAMVVYGDPYAYVISANIHRRHLTAEQKRDLVTELLKAKPERSDRSIAKATKSSPTFVGKVRAEAEEAGTVSTVDTRTGDDGVAQPAHKPAKPEPPKPKPSPAPTPPPAPKSKPPAPPTKRPEAQIRAEAVVVISGLLHRELGETLEDIIRMVRNETAAIDKLSATKRIALVRGFMQALGVTLDDLRPMS